MLRTASASISRSSAFDFGGAFVDLRGALAVGFLAALGCQIPSFFGQAPGPNAIQDFASNHPKNLTAPSLLGEQLAETEQQLDAALLGPGCQGLIVVGALVE